MSNKYCDLVGSRLIKEDFKNINIGFDKVQTDIETANKDIVGMGSFVIDKTKELKDDIDNLSFTGSTHDPLVTASLVDTSGENFGPTGAASYLDGRLSKWEKKQPVTLTTQPTDQPEGGIWYEELSSETINETGLVIENMIVQDPEPTNQSVTLWGDL
jgi:hypothetical protein